MPDRRQHRGPHPEDRQLFTSAMLPVLNRAVADLSWLLSRGYPPDAALQLVGDRFQLVRRQRWAVRRCSCSDQVLWHVQRTEVPAECWQGQHVAVDGFNVLITVEAALAGGVLLLGRDGCLRDMASLHGSFRQVEETAPALERVGQVLSACGVGPTTWYLDRPVSNSGRLAQRIRDLAVHHQWPWQVEVVRDVDHVLKESPHMIATADSGVLGHCQRWCNLAWEVVARRVPTAPLMALDGRSDASLPS